MTKADIPPFLHGQASFTAGTPITANPHDKNATFPPDEYPGDWACWRDGWMFARRIKKFTEEKATQEQAA